MVRVDEIDQDLTKYASSFLSIKLANDSLLCVLMCSHESGLMLLVLYCNIYLCAVEHGIWNCQLYCFAFWKHVHLLQHLSSQILRQNNIWCEVTRYLLIENIRVNNFKCITPIKLETFGHQVCHVYTQLEYDFH